MQYINPEQQTNICEWLGKIKSLIKSNQIVIRSNTWFLGRPFERLAERKKYRIVAKLLKRCKKRKPLPLYSYYLLREYVQKIGFKFGDDGCTFDLKQDIDDIYPIDHIWLLTFATYIYS